VQISWKVICIVTSDVNLPWKHCCPTLNTLRSWQWHVNNDNTHKAFLCSCCNSGYV